jgi:Protein of unknown function (DUF2786)
VKPSDVIKKVEQLFALASSDNENEARNAAYEAAKLMREHELVIAPKGGLPKTNGHVEGAIMGMAPGDFLMAAGLGFLAGEMLKNARR